MECIVPPRKGNQVGFSRIRVTHRILLGFIIMKVFCLPSLFFLLTTPLILLGRWIPYRPSQALGESQGLESDLQGREIFLHKDNQLWAAHVILGYKPSTKRFQKLKNIIKARDLHLALIDVAIPRFLLSEPPSEGTQDTQLLAPLAIRPLLPRTTHPIGRWSQGVHTRACLPGSH